jgi:hypothetical protein
VFAPFITGGARFAPVGLTMGFYKLRKHVALGVAAACLVAGAARAEAQWRVGPDSATRLTRLGRAMAYGTLMGVGFSAVDQWQNEPPEWGHGWPGYGRRLASNLGEFYIQESVTEGLAFAMGRPLDYTRCRCIPTGDRVIWALQGAYLDQQPNGRRYIAIPRIVGAYTGSFAQAMWRPSSGESKLNTALVNGTTSLAIGALINLYYEFRHPAAKQSTMAGDRR